MGSYIIRELDKIVDLIETMPLVADITGIGNNEIDTNVQEIYDIVLKLRKELRNGDNGQE